MTHYAVTAFGADRPGIVAALTGALQRAGANLEDVSSTILRGHFAMMLVVEAPDDPEGLAASLAEAVSPLGVTITMRPIEEGEPWHASSTHALSVYGPDRPGIVAAFSDLLARRGVNVTDLSCRLVDDDGRLYSMIAEVAVPRQADASALERELRDLGRELGLDVSVAAIERDIL